VLPNGYSAREFHPSSAELRSGVRARLGFADDEKVVVFVANELERKGFLPLLQAIASLQDSSVRLLAVGAFRRGEALAQARRVGLEDRVVMVGGTRDVADYYAA